MRAQPIGNGHLTGTAFPRILPLSFEALQLRGASADTLRGLR